jgi:hypothetical protein
MHIPRCILNFRRRDVPEAGSSILYRAFPCVAMLIQIDNVTEGH